MGRPVVYTTVIKVALIILAIKGAWILVGIPAIDNAIINFCTVGLIPGTNVSMGPTATLLLLPAILAFIIGLIFSSNLHRLVHRNTSIITSEVSTRVVKSIKARTAEDSKYKQWVIAMYPILQKQLKLGITKAQPYYERFLEVVYEIIKVSTVYAMRFWAWVEPYLRHFDARLGDKVHQYETTSISLAFSSEMMTTIRKGWSRTKELLDYNLINQQLHK